MKISTSSDIYKFTDKWQKRFYLHKSSDFCSFLSAFIRALCNFSFPVFLIGLYVYGIFSFFLSVGVRYQTFYEAFNSLTAFVSIFVSIVVIALLFGILAVGLLKEVVSPAIGNLLEKRYNRKMIKKANIKKKEPWAVLTMIRGLKARIVDKTCILVEFVDDKDSSPQ